MLTFMNLLAVATADHQLTEREIKFLSKRARELKLTDHQYNLAMNRALAHPGEVQIPRRKADRIELLRDMIRVMAADGVLAEVEKHLFAIVAAYMKFDMAQVDALIDDVLAADVLAADVLAADDLDAAPSVRPAAKAPAKRPSKSAAKSPPKTAKKSTAPAAAKSPPATRRKPKSR